MKKAISLFIIFAFTFIAISPGFSSGQIYYWNPELYENSEMLAYGATIVRDVDVSSTINALIRRVSDGNSENGLIIRLQIINSANSTIFDKTEVTTNHIETLPNLYFARFVVSDGAIPVGEYIIRLSSSTTYGFYNSTYQLSVSTGSKFSIPVPLSVTFLRNSVTINEVIPCVVRVNTIVSYVEFVSETYVASFVSNDYKIWNTTLFFSKSGNFDFVINVINNYNFEYSYNYSVYVSREAERLYIPTVRVFDNGDETYTTIVKSVVWFPTNVYREGPTWHIIADYNNNIIIDMTVAEPKVIQRSWSFYDYETEEIQVIISGVTSEIGVTYVLSDYGNTIKNVFGDIKIKGVNDWRNLWGLIGKSYILNTQDKMIEAGIYNIDYDGTFGFFTSQRTLVVRY